MDIGGLVGTGLGIVSIATLAGLGLLRGTVTNLREQLKDSREEIADKDRRLDAAELKIKEQAADLAALSRVVTGEAHWTAIGNQLEEHHGKAMEHWARDEGVLIEIRDALRGRGQ